jgi:O-antigen biosynthesis protein
VEPGLNLAEQLAEERRLLNGLRADYSAITKSRFHALRMLWFSLKAMLGFHNPKDVFAVWSPGLTVGTGFAAGSKGGRRIISGFRNDVISFPQDQPLSVAVPQLASAWQQLLQACPLAAEPVVSIVIPVYNNCDVTARALESIIEQWSATLACQIIVVDDASTDSTAAMMAQLPGIDYIRNGVNSGFVRSCNRGAALARGPYVCFLNNDTIVTPGWLDELVRTAESDAAIAVVGAKLVYPDGRLQEAGGVIWRDGGGWNYGRGGDPRDPKYSYVRDVDYCSGAALLVRTEPFRKLGGFSDRYTPAYYEDVDLCFAMRQLGYRVVYQPLSTVVHDEGFSSGVSLESGVKRYQAINWPKFVDKWCDVLETHCERDPERVSAAARRLQRSKTILMIDNYVPEFDKDAGSDRMFNLIKQFQAIGFDVIFVPDNYHRSEPYTGILQRMGVEVVYGTENTSNKFDAVRERLPLVDLAWVSRPDVGTRWVPILRERADLPVIYDTVDLHYVRAKRELEMRGTAKPLEWDKWRAERDVELSLIRNADVTIAIAESERDTLADEGVTSTFIIPTMHRIVERKHSFRDTDGILFIGGYRHPPNPDAALWLCNEIMPLIWAELPDLKLTLLGSNPPKSVLDLRSDRVSVPGYLPDVTGYFERARVFVAPLRYGAGIKAKIGHAFGFGLPTVTTTVGSEGFGLIDGEDALIADDAASFASAVVRIYQSESLWNRLSTGAVRRIEPYTPEAVGSSLPTLVATTERVRAKAKSYK